MLVLIRNCGCDDSTTGLAEFNNSEELNKFIKIIIDLNSNSLYGCMPTIKLYEINKDDIIKINEKEENEELDDKYIFYLQGEKYTFADEWLSPYDYEKEDKDLIKKFLNF